MAAYYLLYEGLHTLSHLDDRRHPYLKYIPLINTVRRMHYIHHAPGFMQTRNFNLTFPVCDALFGTSDLDRGLIGTLFNGRSHRFMRKDLRPDEDVAVSMPPSREATAAGHAVEGSRLQDGARGAECRRHDAGAGDPPWRNVHHQWRCQRQPGP